MTHPLLTRAHLEAVLVGLAAIRPDLAPDLSAQIATDRVSPAARALLEAMLEHPALAWQCLPALAKTAGQHELAERAFGMAAKDLTFHSPRTLVALVNQLPSTLRPREAAWERDLAVVAGVETAA